MTPNETEAAELAGGNSQKHAREIGAILKTRLHVKNVVLSLGKNGAVLCGDHDEIVPAYPVDPVDTTGAGDAFNGGLAVALARGETLTSAVKFANAVAALSTTRSGAQSSMPVIEEVDAFLKLHQSL